MPIPSTIYIPPVPFTPAPQGTQIDQVTGIPYTTTGPNPGF